MANSLYNSGPILVDDCTVFNKVSDGRPAATPFQEASSQPKCLSCPCSFVPVVCHSSGSFGFCCFFQFFSSSRFSGSSCSLCSSCSVLLLLLALFVLVLILVLLVLLFVLVLVVLLVLFVFPVFLFFLFFLFSLFFLFCLCGCFSGQSCHVITVGLQSQFIETFFLSVVPHEAVAEVSRRGKL